jgi:hypothetical protein
MQEFEFQQDRASLSLNIFRTKFSFSNKEFGMHEIGIRLIDAGSGSMLWKVNSSLDEL